MKFSKHSLLLFISLIFFSSQVCAQNGQSTDTANNKWKFIVEPYLMFPSMQGSIGLGVLPPVDVDANASDIFSNLKIGGMLYMEAKNDTWAISSDFVYMDLEQKATGSRLVESGKVSSKETIWEVAGFYRIFPWLEAGIGSRLVSLSGDIKIVPAIGEQNELSGSFSETWVDPILVARSQHVVNNKWLFDFRGDIGGFGLGSDFTWQVIANAGYKFSDLFQLMIGYRYLGIDYENGSGINGFVYNVDTSGPMFRFGFNF